MRRLKKEKKEKKTGVKLWPTWLTILLVFLGVGAISGITILGVYLAGGFEEKVINPESISFSYDEDLYNQSTGQIEVVDDFVLTITSPESYITANKVTLSFVDSNITHTTIDDDGLRYIDNEIIQVPETVTIGQPFTVKLVKDNYLVDDEGNEILDNYNQSIDWIVGGISTLKATSEYNMITAPTLQIAVDVPVYKTETIAINSLGEETNQIVTGETFTLQTKFYPANSQYLYSDDINDNIANEEKREKHSFYQAVNVTSSTLLTRYEGKYNVSFVAGDNAVDRIELYGYTFKDALEQNEIEMQYQDYQDELFYSQILGYLFSSTKSASSSCEIKIGAASVSNFTMNKAGSEISMNVDNSLRLYINEYLYEQNSQFLGVNIYSTSGALIENMLSNIGISFSYNGSDPTIGDNAFLKVNGGDYEDIDGIRYYRPYSNVENKNYCYWDILATREANITVSVVLLIENEGEVITLFGDSVPLIYEFELNVANSQESEISWADSSDIEIMLDYNQDGTINPYTINLDDLVSIPSSNIYQTYVFFAYFGDGEKDALISTVDDIIGSTGYNYNLSGYYSTDIENLLLFALNGNTLTLQNTGSLRLYYATIVTENGVPVYDIDQDGNRTYKIAVMCDDYINISCDKALNQDSVNVGDIDTSAFEIVDEEILINQGTTNSLNITFKVNAESVPVFQEEYDNNHINLSIKDNNLTDITKYFSINHNFTVEQTTGIGTLEYSLTLNSGISIPEKDGIYLYQFLLNYNNNDNNIEWAMLAPQDIRICIYSPIAESIEIATNIDYQYNNFITGNETVYVVQTLVAGGNFDTTIDIGDEQVSSVSELLLRLLGPDNSFVIITDQKQQTNTLANEWTFVVADGNGDAINLNGQTFTFSQADGQSVTLALESLDGQSSSLDIGQSIILNISSDGITYVEKTDSLNPFVDNQYIVSDISNITVNKYGAKSESSTDLLDLNALVKFYVGDELNRQQYTNIRFQLSSQYLYDSTLTDQMVLDLFGPNGMLTLYNETGIIGGLNGDAASIRSTLSGQTITKISINKDFAIDHSLKFTISDTGPNGAVNATLTLILNANINLTTQNYPNDGQPLYASEELVIGNTITNNYKEYIGEGYNNSFSSLFDGNTYYIVRNGNNYILQSNIPSSYIGVFYSDSGTIVFNDFWDVESQTFSISFTPTGRNTFTLNRTISFEVTRDLAIDDIGNVYYIISDSMNYSIYDFVDIHRLSTADMPESESSISSEDFEQSFVFSDYLVYQNGNVVKDEDSFFVFDYNTTELTTTLSIYYIQRGTNNEIMNEVLLDTIEITIKLYSQSTSSGENFDIYQYIADKIYYSADTSISAQIQNVGNTEYIMLQEGTWQLDNNFATAGVGNNNFYIYANMRTYSTTGNSQSTSNYLSVIEGSTLTTRNATNSLIQGLEQQIFIVFYFGSSNESVVARPEFPGTIAVMYVPLIISSIGFDYVNYEQGVAQEDKLATALTEPNTLIDNGIYDTISAGQVTQILREYKFGEKISDNGLYLLSNQNFTINIEYYALDTTGAIQASEDIKKLISIESIQNEEGTAERVGEITLNHLSTNMNNFYIALKYTITYSSSGDSKEFYYLLKVEPDVIVNSSVYAYNGTSEYLESQEGQENMVELDNIFGSTTLNENEKRFNITKKLSLKEYNKIESEITLLDDVKTLDVNVTSDMMLYLSLKNSNNSLITEEILISITKYVTIIDLNEIFAEIAIEEYDTLVIKSIAGEGTIYYNGREIISSRDILTELSVDVESDMQVWLSVTDKNGEAKTTDKLITITQEDKTLDLSNIFGEETTLERDDIVLIRIISGKGDFYYNAVKIFSDLKFVNAVESVTVGEIIYNTQSEWERAGVVISFSEDYSQMYYRTTSKEQVSVTIKHSYQGGANDDELSVIGGEQYYTFILNATSYDYSVSFENKKDGQTFVTNDENQIYTWNISRQDIAESVNNTLTLDIKLLEGYVAGSSPSYTEVWDKLEVTMTGENTASGEIDFNTQSAIEENDLGEKLYSYDNSKASASRGVFSITFADYISSDREIEFTLHTIEGYLATLIINVEATASVNAEETLNGVLKGGKTYDFDKVFDIKLAGQTTSSYIVDIDEKSISSSTVDSNKFDGTDFFVFSDGTFIVADIINDYSVTINVTITFDEIAGEDYAGKVFTFAYTLKLEHNISYNLSAAGGSVIAGEEVNIDESKIFTQGSSYSYGNSKIEYTGSSSSPAFSKIEGNIIKTSYISNDTSVDIRLTIKIYFDYKGDGIDENDAYQTFIITYSIMVYKSVKAEINYPYLNNQEMAQEYLDNGTKFENILNDFLSHNAVFAYGETNEEGIIELASRVEFIEGQLVDGKAEYKNKITSLNTGELKIILLRMSNASIYTDTANNGLDIDDKNYIVGEEISAGSNITFMRGTWTSSANGIKFNDNGSESYVTFEITYQNVTCQYTVYILTNSLTVQLNSVSEFVQNGNYNGNTVSYEILYVDKTSTSDLFAQNRMAQITFNSDFTTKGSYYIVFANQAGYSTATSGVKFYASYPIYLDGNDAGKSVTIDLGYSMANSDYSDFVYVGTYLVSSFESNLLTVEDDGLIRKGTITAENYRYEDATWDNINDVVNSDTDNRIFTNITLANRIQLVYGGSNGVAVDYKHYYEYLNNFSFIGESNEINYPLDDISTINTFIKIFNKNDGSTNQTKQIQLNYYFMPSIDIDVDEKVTDLHNLVQLEVSYEEPSMVEKFGVKHPTTGEYVSEGDFGEGKASLLFETLDHAYGADTDEDYNALFDDYLIYYNATDEGFRIDSPKSTDANRYVYLYISTVLNAGRYAYDYTLLPLGADNQGDYVLTKLTYSVPVETTYYERVFYVIVKIVPDYNIVFENGEGADSDENNEVVSNIENIYNIATTQDSSKYPRFTLTSTQNEAGYVSVKHKNGSYQNLELATSNFEITLKAQSETIGGIVYNDATNIEQKLQEDLNAKWIKSEDNGIITYTLNSANGSTTTFSDAKSVIFGKQYYYIEAEDNYGFKYQVYFSLQSSYTEPSINADNLTLTELSYLDFSSPYDLLEITTTEENSSTIYSLKTQQISPEQADIDVNLVEISGIDSWVFGTDPVPGDGIGTGGIMKNDNGGYRISIEDKENWDTLDEKYFEVPLISNISIESVMFYDTEDNPIINSPIEPTKVDENASGYILATTSDGTFNGLFGGKDYGRAPYTSPDTGSEEVNTVEGQEYLPFQVPRIEDTSLFKDSDTASAQMVVRLKYQGKDNEGVEVIEYYDLQVNVTIRREVTIMEQENDPVRDGISFSLEDEIQITSGGEEVGNSKVKYINDTLEVLVAGSKTTTFYMNLYRDGKLLNDAPAVVNISNTGVSWAKTEYISISSYIGTNIQEGDNLEIIPQDENAEFYYVYNSNNDATYYHYVARLNSDDNFELRQVIKEQDGENELVYSDTQSYVIMSSISKDVIYVENASLLSSRYYYNVRKYYVISVDFDSTGQNTPFNYRFSKEYDVTGLFFGLEPTYTGQEVANTIYATAGEDGEGNITITSTFDQWAESSFKLILANSDLEGDSSKLDNVINSSDWNKYLTFTLNSSDGASGSAKVDEQGNLIFYDDFVYRQYIKIIIRMKVSGTDRDILNDNDNCGTISLTRPATTDSGDGIRLAWAEDYRA